MNVFAADILPEESPLGVVTLTKRVPGLALPAIVTEHVSCVPPPFTRMLVVVNPVSALLFFEPLPWPLSSSPGLGDPSMKLTPVAPVSLAPVIVRVKVVPAFALDGERLWMEGALAAEF